jgi:hypothetical protein
MNTYKNTSKRLIAMISGACMLSILLLSSCLKQNDNQTYNPPVALVTVIQASPDEAPLDFSLDNSKVNINPLNFGDHIGYFQAYAGNRQIKFVNHATSGNIFADTATLAQNTAYSLFLANKPAQPEILLIKDTVSRPADGKASIRFINLSPDAPAVDLAVTGGAVLIGNEAYKGHSTFIPVTGNINYNFEIRQHGTVTVLATLANISLNSSYVYTIWFGGLITPTTTTDKAAINIVTNAFY